MTPPPPPVTATNLLPDEHLESFSPTLAAHLGLNEAIVLQKIHSWVRHNQRRQQTYANGFYWTYNTIPEWQMALPWWSYTTLKRILSNLESRGLIIVEQLMPDQRDRTCWYRINYSAMDQLLLDLVHPEIADESGSDPIGSNWPDASAMRPIWPHATPPNWPDASPVEWPDVYKEQSTNIQSTNAPDPSLRSVTAEEEKEEKPARPQRARGARGGTRNANTEENQPRSSSLAKNSSFAGKSNGLGSKAGKQGQQHPTPQAARPPAPPVDRRDPLNAAMAEALYSGLPLTERDWQSIDRARAELQVAQAKPEEIAPLVAWLSADRFWAERIGPGALASQINKWRAATARQASAPESKDDMAARLKAKYGHRDKKAAKKE